MALPRPPETTRLLELAARHAIAEEGGGPERREHERTSGKLSPRERIEALLDEGSFEETDRFVTHIATDFGMASQRVPGDGCVTGYGRIHGRVVCVFAQDFTVFGGTLSEANAAKIARIADTATQIGAPIIGLHDTCGARIQEGVAALAGYGDLFLRNTLASGVVPQIAAILGPCIGAAAFLPALADFTIMTRETSSLAVNGPGPVKAATNEELTLAELGNAAIHSEISGAAHLLADDDRHALALIRNLLTFLPSSHQSTPPYKPTLDDPTRADASLETLLPEPPPTSDQPQPQPYDMLDVIRRIVDRDETGTGSLFQIHPHFARNILTGFARMDGRPVGIVANQPTILGGALDSDACIKAARFVRFCDAFNIPLITFEDTPGFLPGLAQEHHGLARHGAQLLYAFAEATVPKLAVVLRRAYGAAYCAMSSKHLRTDLNLAWPSAEITVTEPGAAISILYRRELESIVRRVQAIMPQGVALTERQKLEVLAEAHTEKVDEFRERFASPYIAAERGYLDAVILPSETRSRLNAALDRLTSKRSNPSRKHGNIPL
jgi:propionyl-CoA carboxylase beta chain